MNGPPSSRSLRSRASNMGRCAALDRDSPIAVSPYLGKKGTAGKRGKWGLGQTRGRRVLSRPSCSGKPRSDSSRPNGRPGPAARAAGDVPRMQSYPRCHHGPRIGQESILVNRKMRSARKQASAASPVGGQNRDGHISSRTRTPLGGCSPPTSGPPAVAPRRRRVMRATPYDHTGRPWHAETLPTLCPCQEQL